MKFADLDAVELRTDIEVTFTVGPPFVISAGTKGTVVQVLGNPEDPPAYLVDVFHKPTNQYGVATVRADQLIPA
jgi:hypothetical protein